MPHRLWVWQQPPTADMCAGRRRHPASRFRDMQACPSAYTHTGPGAGHGVPELRQYLADRASPGRWVLEPDAVTDRSEEELALEVVRESIFRRFYEGEQQESQCPLACLCAGAHG